MAIEKRGANSWRVGFQVEDLPGRPWIRETLRFPPSMSEFRQRKEAEKKLASMITAYENGTLRHTSRTKYTVRTFSDLWMSQHVLPTLKPTTAKTYRSILDAHILPALGDMPLKSLTALQLTQWLNTVREVKSNRNPSRMINSKIPAGRPTPKRLPGTKPRIRRCPSAPCSMYTLP